MLNEAHVYVILIGLEIEISRSIGQHDTSVIPVDIKGITLVDCG
jgi:hypothetical protein